MTNEEIRSFIENAIQENKVMLFMKGTPQQPACGFSMRASGALNTLGVKYAALDILPDPRIREELSSVSGWPTIPQLFVDGELIGGSDIVMEMFESGELAETLGVDQPALGETSPGEPSASEQPPQRQTGIGLENRLG
jgi:monothiol glutaredoxin